MDGAVNEHEILILPLQAVDRAHTTVGRAVVHDPEDAPRVAIRKCRHHLRDESVERIDTRRRLAAANNRAWCTSNAGRQVGPNARARIRVRHS
jgi:hypothetical protein